MYHQAPEFVEMSGGLIGFLAIPLIAFLVSVVVTCLILHDAQKRVPPLFRQTEPAFSRSQRCTSCHSVARSGKGSTARSGETKSPENTGESRVSGPLASGTPRGIRTHDPRIKNPLLCQLS